MNYFYATIATFFCIILSQDVQAQNFYIKASLTFGGSGVVTEKAGYANHNYKDAHAGNSTLSLEDFSHVVGMTLDTDQTLDITAGGTNIGTVQFNAFTITKTVDRSSPKFFLAQCAGSAMTLEFLSVTEDRGGYKEVAHKIVLKNASVKTISQVSVPGCTCFEETITFEYSRMEIYPYAFDDATQKFSPLPMIGWDRLLNKRVTQ
jgi:type VI secretion system Hcp family effector